MTDLVAAFDADVWRWTASSGRGPGPAGIASVELGPGVQMVVDAFDGAPLELSVDAVAESGGLDDVTAELAAAVCEGSWSEGAPIGLRDAAAPALCRLALLEEAARDRGAVGAISPEWQWEADALRRSIGLSAASPSSDFGAAAEWTSPAPGIAASRFRAGAHALGRIAVDGPVALDASFVRGGLLDLATARSRFVREDDLLTFGAGIRAGVYAAEVEAVTSLVIDAVEDLVVAIAPLTLGNSPWPDVGATADLLVGGDRTLAELDLVLVEQVSAAPRGRLRRVRRATHFARRSTQAMRLGLADEARELLGASTSDWTSLRIDRFGVQLGDAAIEPFAGELADLTG